MPATVVKARTPDPREKTHRTLPARACLEHVVTVIRETNRIGQQRLAGGGQTPRERKAVTTAGSREMVILGRLLHHWHEIVGPDLAGQTWPTRLFQGRLRLICSDSQWLHTLQFLKDEILHKIRDRYPDFGITSIQAELGPIPTDALPREEDPWPGWQQEPAPVLPADADPELTAIAERGARKTLARIKGLTREGYVMCPACQGALIPTGVAVCSVCEHRARLAILTRVRSFLNLYPEATNEEVANEIPEATLQETELIRDELVAESRTRIQELAAEALRLLDRDEDAQQELAELRFEIVRLNVLRGIPRFGFVPKDREFADIVGTSCHAMLVTLKEGHHLC